MIQVSGVTKAFSSKNSEVLAVDNAYIEVKTGEFVLILGRSGSGKSTLLGMLAGLIRPTSGIIRFEGVDISSLPEDKIAALRAEKIGFVFQFSGLIPTITALRECIAANAFLSRWSWQPFTGCRTPQKSGNVRKGRCLSPYSVKR